MRMNISTGCGSHSQDQGEEAWDQSGQLMNSREIHDVLFLQWYSQYLCVHAYSDEIAYIFT